MPGRSILLALLLLPFAKVAAAPFAPEEVARRMKTGAELSGLCYLEAKINHEVTGENCTTLMNWTESEFPLIAPNLEHTTPAAVADFETYKTNLTAILAIADAAAQPLAAHHPAL